jgi:bifunctional non-homologous end joining protein LigD
MALTEYKRKRHFNRTPEPAGKKAAKAGWSYVIQKHAASHLHYDFRLELDGVLKSWAVPKGPSLDPTVKRLAMHVEDHPVDYGSFEGIIPQGEYGGGTVMLWDRGSWEPVGDAREGYRTGRLKFILHGEKLRGRWMLVRTSRGSAFERDQRQWLLFKERDDEAKSQDKGDILMDEPVSVESGRDLDEIAADGDAVWSSMPTSNGKRTNRRVKTKGKNVNVRRRATPRNTAALKQALADYDAKKETFAGVRMTSPNKVLYPEQGITKLELANYYRTIADWVLPHIADRPLVLVRCPEGRGKECFYQKHPAAGTPDTLRQVMIREKTKAEPYVFADDVDALISLAQISALEVHAWGSRADKLESPDRLIFDLDPDPSVDWNFVVQSAREVRRFLQELGLESFVKTTGGKGLHVVVPIDRRHDWDEAKDFCKRVADAIVTADPEHYTVNMSKAARPGKIFIDYLRNGRGATAIIPYSTRAREGAPVSVPLTWEELSARIRSDHYNVRNLPQRLEKLKSDPWKNIAKVRQSLTGAIKALKKLTPVIDNS